MADVKWIKITTDIFDDEKILLIESLPEADSIIVIWFKLLCLAGKQNNSGVFMMGNSMPYTDSMLATIFRRKECTVKLALQTFQQFGMIDIIDNVITIPNWGKHQNLDQLESKKEYMRNYMSEYRKKQKVLTTGKSNCKTNSKSNVRQADKIREDIDKNKIREEQERENEIIRTEYGKFNNVFLSEEEFQKLQDKFPSDFNAKIEYLSSYMQRTGKTYSDHYEQILYWDKQDKEKEAQQPKQKTSSNPFVALMEQSGMI